MALSTYRLMSLFSLVVWKLDIAFAASSGKRIEFQIALAMDAAIVAGFLWLGFLYFFVLGGVPLALKALVIPVAARAKNVSRKSRPVDCGGSGGAPWSAGWLDSATS